MVVGDDDPLNALLNQHWYGPLCEYHLCGKETCGKDIDVVYT